MKQAVLDTVVSAVEDGARPTDLKSPFGVFVNLEILGGHLPPFILPQDLVDLAEKAGLRSQSRIQAVFISGFKPFWF